MDTGATTISHDKMLVSTSVDDFGTGPARLSGRLNFPEGFCLLPSEFLLGQNPQVPELGQFLQGLDGRSGRPFPRPGPEPFDFIVKRCEKLELARKS